MKIEDWENCFEKQPERTATRFVFVVIGIALLAGAAIGVTNFLLTPARTVSGIVNRTLDADNVIYNYEWFHRQYGDYQALGQKLESALASKAEFDSAVGPRSEWTFEDKQESARLSSIVLGLQNQRASLVQDYNAHARMSNRSIFMGTTLPDSLE